MVCRDAIMSKITTSPKTTVMNHQSRTEGSDTLPIDSWEAEILHTNQESHNRMIHDVKEIQILKVPTQEPSTSSKYGLQGRGAREAHLQLC